MIHQERRAATCSWPSVRSREVFCGGCPSGRACPQVSCTVTVQRPRTFGSIFLQASCFLYGCTYEEQCVWWQFILCSSYLQPCRTHCVALTALCSVQGSRGSVYSEGPEAEEDAEGYLRRKRCARMAASSGLTGVASCPRRLTGGMLPN